MDPLFDQVRQRTDELRRVADAARRERDLRATGVTAAARTPTTLPLATTTSAARDDEAGTCTPTGIAA